MTWVVVVSNCPDKKKMITKTNHQIIVKKLNTKSDQGRHKE